MFSKMKPNYYGIAIACCFGFGAVACVVTGHMDLAKDLALMGLAQAGFPAIHEQHDGE